LPLIIIRISHALQARRISPFGQLVAYLNILLFGVDVAIKCEIGPGFFLPHTSGTVIGAAKIGENVTIYQNVTLGAKYADMAWCVEKRPTIGDNVILGAGCKVLGAAHIGAGSVVGANSVVLDDVPENSLVVGIPGCIVKTLGTKHAEEEMR
jgi:serine O-acetyltransferase